MKIIIAKTAGFCMGVRRAVELTLDASNTGQKPICTYGPLIHNPQVLDILKEKGIDSIHDIPEAGHGTVIIRAHGVPPQTKERLEKVGFHVIDATCPRVIKVQTIIHNHAAKGYAVIIVGDPDHPEVKGLLGYAGDKGWVVDDWDGLNALPEFEKAIIVAQTTQNSHFFKEVMEWAAQRYPHYKIFNTICDSTEKRQAEVTRLSNTVDAIVVVGGKNSGNTQRLAEVATESGVKAFHIEKETDLDAAALGSARAVGITAGASTPNWVINRVYRRMETLPFEKKRKGMKQLLMIQRLLLLTNAYVGLGAGCLAYACVSLQGILHYHLYLLIASLYIMYMHTFNHLTGIHSDRFNDHERAMFYQQHKKGLACTAVLSGLIALITAYSIGWFPFIILCVMTVLGMWYSLRGVTYPNPPVHYRRLKEIPGSKTILIGLAWGFITTLFPAVSVSHVFSGAVITAFIWSSGMVFVRTAFFDMQAMQGDRIVGKETIPIVLGEKRTKKLLHNCLLCLMIILILAGAFKIIPSLGFLLLLPTAGLLGILFVYERGWLMAGLKLTFLVESSFILAGLLTLLWSA